MLGISVTDGPTDGQSRFDKDLASPNSRKINGPISKIL